MTKTQTLSLFFKLLGYYLIVKAALLVIGISIYLATSGDLFLKPQIMYPQLISFVVYIMVAVILVFTSLTLATSITKERVYKNKEFSPLSKKDVHELLVSSAGVLILASSIPKLPAFMITAINTVVLMGLSTAVSNYYLELVNLVASIGMGVFLVVNAKQVIAWSSKLSSDRSK